jgi:cobyrinic acid a,c-diamide synthase
MVGVIPADVIMHERPQGRGYVQLRETPAGPWPAADGAPEVISAHEFHYSRLENVDPGLTYAYEVVRGAGIDGRHDGIVLRNLLASYSHLRDTGRNHWAARFVAHVKACRRSAAGANCIDSP